MNRYESRIAETYLSLYYSIIRDNLIEKRREELKLKENDENIGGGKSSNPKSLESEIVKRLDDNKIKFYENVLDKVSVVLNDIDDIERSIIDVMYNIDYYTKLGRKTTEETAKEFGMDTTFISSVRSNVIKRLIEVL